MILRDVCETKTKILLCRAMAGIKFCVSPGVHSLDESPAPHVLSTRVVHTTDTILTGIKFQNLFIDTIFRSVERTPAIVGSAHFSCTIFPSQNYVDDDSHLPSPTLGNTISRTTQSELSTYDPPVNLRIKTLGSAEVYASGSQISRHSLQPIRYSIFL